MYELGHVLLLFWGGQIRVVGSQSVKNRPAVAAQFLAILRTIFPKLVVPLWKETNHGLVQSLQNQKATKFPFCSPQTEAH